MLLRLLLAVLVSFTAPASVEDPAPAAPARSACGTCAGTGSAMLPCDGCGGDGKAPCVECSNPYPARSLALRRRLLSPEKLAELEKLERTKHAVEQVLGAGDEAGPGIPGRTACTSHCNEGRTPMTGRPCLVCDRKGWLPCVACRGKGESSCTRCAGKQRFVRPCPECAGAKTSVAVEALDPATIDRCSWCDGAEIRACFACDESGRRAIVCRACAGTGDHFCPACRGSRKATCRDCGGSGDMSPVYGKPKPQDCRGCDAKGAIPCKRCKGGSVVCADCSGEPRRVATCDLCLGGKKAWCEGCVDGATLSWTSRAERSAAAGRKDAAIAFLQAGIRREEATTASRLLTARGPEHEQSIRSASASRRAALSSRVEQLKKAP